MRIEKFQEADVEEILTLFYETIHTVNAKDYTKEERNAWAPKADFTEKLETWKYSLQKNITFVAKIDGDIVGFSDMDDQGYLDRLFVHKDYQGQGIAKKLVQHLEAVARERQIGKIQTDASITARPFFEKQGYAVLRKQRIKRKGVIITNYKMTKQLNEVKR